MLGRQLSFPFGAFISGYISREKLLLFVFREASLQLLQGQAAETCEAKTQRFAHFVVVSYLSEGKDVKMHH